MRAGIVRIIAVCLVGIASNRWFGCAFPLGNFRFLAKAGVERSQHALSRSCPSPNSIMLMTVPEAEATPTLLKRRRGIESSLDSYESHRLSMSDVKIVSKIKSKSTISRLKQIITTVPTTFKVTSIDASSLDRKYLTVKSLKKQKRIKIVIRSTSSRTKRNATTDKTVQSKLNVTVNDDYFENEVYDEVDTSEIASQWVARKDDYLENLDFIRPSEIFMNPGVVEPQRTILNRKGAVPLSELNRRGLLPPPPRTPHDILFGRSAVEKEIRTNFSIFTMTVVGSKLLLGGTDNDVMIMDSKSFERIGSLVGHSKWINDIFADPRNATRVYTASDDGTARLWDIVSMKCLAVYKGLSGPALVIYAVGKELIVTGQSEILVFGADDAVRLNTLTGHGLVLRAMSEGKQFSKNLQIDDRIVQARLPSSLFGYKVGGVVAHEPYLLTSVDDGTIWVWNRTSKLLERKLTAFDVAPGTWVRPLLICALPDSNCNDGKSKPKLISGWADGAIRIFNLKTWELERTIQGHNGPILSLQCVAGGRLLSGGSDMVALEWDPSSWTISRSFTGHRGAVCASVELPPIRAKSDGEGNCPRLLTASIDGVMKLWSSNSRRA